MKPKETNLDLNYEWAQTLEKWCGKTLEYHDWGSATLEEVFEKLKAFDEEYGMDAIVGGMYIGMELKVPPSMLSEESSEVYYVIKFKYQISSDMDS